MSQNDEEAKILLFIFVSPYSNRLHYGEYSINRQRLQVVNVFF